jgi:Gpi18-like mannosyltransferase
VEGVSWGFACVVFKILDKLFFFLGEFLRSQIKIYLFHSLFSFFFLFFLFRLLKEYFFIDKFVVYSLLFFTLTSSIFYYFRSALHHSQAGIFILGIIYFLKNRRYILAGLFAGLAVYSYLPIIFAVSGITLAYFCIRETLGLFFLSLCSP